jgi:SPP1 gp7 family putative phage head morphogenesis protein
MTTITTTARAAVPNLAPRVDAHAHAHAHAREGDGHGLATHTHGDRRDPTGTTTARRRYAAQFGKRWRAIAGAIRSVVVDADAFGLRSNVGAASDHVDATQRRVPSPERVPDVPPPAEPSYEFPTDEPEQAAAPFRAWLTNAMDVTVLGEDEGDISDPSRLWTAQYVRYAVARGIKHAERALLQQTDIPVDPLAIDDAFNLPIHRRTLRRFFQRQYRYLDGITDDVAQDVSRTLAEGLSRGANPRDIARDLADRVNAVGDTRSRTLARTEVVSAFHESTLDRYESIMGSSAQVRVVAEFTTAGDDRVCPQCEALDGRTFRIAEARGIIPVHPQCRCSVSPITAATSAVT